VPVFETERGGRIDLVLPPPEWKELEQVITAYEDLKGERNVTLSGLSGLTAERERAIEADRRVLKEWIRDGKKGTEPAAKEVEKVEKRIAACNRRLEALEEALDDAETDLIAVVDEHGGAWAEEVDVTHAEAREEYAQAVEALSVARNKVAQRFALLYWLRHFPDEVRYRVRGAYLPGLIASWGDPYTFADVLVALRDDAQARPGTDTSRGQDPLTNALAGEGQRIHEERARNEQAGKGYFTEEELMRIADGTLEFSDGVGARRVRRMSEVQRESQAVATPAGIFFPPGSEGSDRDEE
jgi:hypothetical protein